MRIAILLFSLFLSACASVPSDAPSYTPAPAIESGKGLIYIYRVGAYPTMRTPDILIDGKLVFAPPEKSYTWVHLPLGKHQITVDWTWDTGWPDLFFEIDVGDHEPLFIKLSGSFENFGLKYRAGSRATGIAPAAAERELQACCKYIPSKSQF